MARITVRFYGGASAAAGAEETHVDASTLEELIANVRRDCVGCLDRVLAASSFLVNGTVAGDGDRALSEGDVVDVLPPFAGG